MCESLFRGRLEPAVGQLTDRIMIGARSESSMSGET